MTSREELQERWNRLYRNTLPQLAKCRDEVQATWPVHLDHCFARIILDNAVGITKPWTETVKAPAWKHMTREQLMDAIELGERIAVGEVNLEGLNEKSLELRGKAGGRVAKRKGDAPDQADRATKRYQHEDGDGPGKKASVVISSYFSPTQSRTAKAGDLMKKPPTERSVELQDDRGGLLEDTPLMTNPITLEKCPSGDPFALIAASRLSAFRKEVLTLLCRVPRGRYTTYAAMSAQIGATSHKTCARAVGNAMRNNPFAPVVPCHRVLAHDGQIGGFGGHWGEEGKYARRKREMLREEGVRFDGKGKAVGEPFRDFGSVG